MRSFTKLFFLLGLLIVVQSCSKEDQERLKQPLEQAILGDWEMDETAITYKDHSGREWTVNVEEDADHSEIFTFDEKKFSIKRNDKVDSYVYSLPNQELKSDYDFDIPQEIAIEKLPDAGIILLVDKLILAISYELENHNEYDSITLIKSFNRVK